MVSAKVVNTTEVAVRSKGFLSNFHDVFLHESSNTINEAEELDIGSSLLESKKTINNIVATWSLSAKIDDTKGHLFVRNLTPPFLVHISKD